MNKNQHQAKPVDRVIAAIPDGLWDWRCEDDLLWGSDRFWRLIGLGHEEGSATTLDDWLQRAHPADQDRVREILDRLVHENRPAMTDCRFWTGDDEYRWFTLGAAANAHRGERVSHVSGWLRDVHDLRMQREVAQQREANFRQRQRMVAVNCLAGGMAHEFNNVMQIIRGYVTYARDSLEPGSEPREDLEEALLASQRATDLTSRLLDFSRPEDDSELVNVGRVIADLESRLRPLLGEDTRLITSWTDGPMMVTGAEGALGQALLNLCLNARDATPQDGMLQIRAERFGISNRTESIGWGLAAGDYCRIWVSDNGCGVTEDLRERIFDPFFSTKDARHGTGLGLAVVLGVVERLGGAIELHSVVDVGTSFAVYLPLALPVELDEVGVRAVPTARPKYDATNPTTLLFVDPERSAVRGIQESLERMGARVLVAPDTRTALALCRRHGRIDGAVIDEQLAPAVTDTLRSHVIGRVLLSTRFDPESDYHGLRRDLGDGAIAKPFCENQLLDLLAVSEGSSDQHSDGRIGFGNAAIAEAGVGAGGGDA